MAMWGWIFSLFFCPLSRKFHGSQTALWSCRWLFEVATSHTTLYPSYVQEANWNEKKKGWCIFDCTWGIMGTLPVEVLVLFKATVVPRPAGHKKRGTVRAFSVSLFGTNSFLRTFKVQFCWSNGKNRTAAKTIFTFTFFAQNFWRVAICVTKTGKGNKVMPTNETMWKICRSSRNRVIMLNISVKICQKTVVIVL